MSKEHSSSSGYQRHTDNLKYTAQELQLSTNRFERLMGLIALLEPYNLSFRRTLLFKSRLQGSTIREFSEARTDGAKPYVTSLTRQLSIGADEGDVYVQAKYFERMHEGEIELMAEYDKGNGATMSEHAHKAELEGFTPDIEWQLGRLATAVINIQMGFLPNTNL